MTFRTTIIGSLATLSLLACTAQTPSNGDTTSSHPSMKRAAMEWTAVQTGTGESDMPEMEIVLQVAGTGEELYRTMCAGTTSTEAQDMEGSVASIQCWWAGGGDQYGVFIGDAEEATIRHRTVDEEAGFGAWEDLKTL